MKSKDQEIKKSLKSFRVLEANSDWANETLHILKNIPTDVTKIKTKRYRKIDNLIFKLLSMGRKHVAIFGILGITLLGVVSYLIVSGIKRVDHNLVYVTGAEKDQVLEDISKNNPLILDEDAGVVPEDFNYAYTKATWIDGPKYGECKISGASGGTYFGDEYTASFEQWTYYETISNSSFKTVLMNKDGKIQNIFISDMTDPTKSIQYRYEGGKYAVREITEMYIDEGYVEGTEYSEDKFDPINDSLSDYESFVKDFYSQIPNVYKDKENNYILEYTYDVNCDSKFGAQFNNSASDTTNKMITRDYISSKSFQIFKTESYLDSVENDNLVRESTYEYDLREVADISEVKSNFDAPADIPVRDIEPINFNDDWDLQSVQNRINNTLSLIKEKNLPILYMQDTDTYSNSVHGDAQIYAVSELYNITDRDFFADDEGGEKSYQFAVKNKEDMAYTASPLQISISRISDIGEDADLSTGIMVFNYHEDTKDPDKLFDANFFSSEDYVILGQETKKIEVDGQEFELYIKKYESEITNPVKTGDNIGTTIDKKYLYDCNDNFCKYVENKIALKFDGGFYTFDSFVFNSNATLENLINHLTNDSFEIYWPENESDMEKIEDLVKKSMFSFGI